MVPAPLRVIDNSLCIIQDSKKDWEKEATTMKDVYSGATLNLSASAAEGGQVGMFFSEDPNLLQPLRVYAYDMKGRVMLWTGNMDAEWELNVETSPLSTRGWMLQERALATRTLHFCKTQLYWECSHLKACRSFPRGNLQLIPPYLSLTPIPVAGDIYSWPRLVEYYTKTYLTFDGDKLVALSGISRLFHESGVMKSEFVAGMWRKDLEHQLLWFPVLLAIRDEKRGRRRPDYLAPSWSWASLNAEMHIAWKEPEETFTMLEEPTGEPPNRSILLAVADVHIEVSGADPFGQIKSGALTLSTKHLRRIYNHSVPVLHMTRAGWVHCEDQDIPLSFDDLVEPSNIDKETEAMSFCGYHVAAEGGSFKNPFSSLHLLFVTRREGLILQPLVEKRGVYSRLGRFDILPRGLDIEKMTRKDRAPFNQWCKGPDEPKTSWVEPVFDEDMYVSKTDDPDVEFPYQITLI